MDPLPAAVTLDAVIDAWLTPPPPAVLDVSAGGRLPAPGIVALELPDAPLQTLPPSDAHRAWGGGAQAFAYFWDGAGPTVALVHGWGGCAGIWSLWVGQLLRAGYRVVSIDAPAHGAAPGNRASAPAIAGTVRAASREVGPFAATVSHSLGAIASSLAAADGEPLVAMVHLAACVEVDGTLLETAGSLELPRERIPALRERLAERLARTCH